MRKYLIVGFGGAGRRALKCMCEIDPVAEFAIWNTGKSTEFYAGTRYTLIESLDGALCFGADGVFISTPTSKHIEYAQLFLNAVKWIVIDKPLDSDLNKCEVFCRNAKYSHTKVYINFQRRYLPCWIRLSEILKEGNTGALIYGLVKVYSFYPEWRPDKNPEELYASRKDLGGGVLLTECHEIDLINWLLGPIFRVDARIMENTEKNKVENQAQLLLDVQTEYGDRSITVVLNDKILPSERLIELSFEKMTIRVEEDKSRIIKRDLSGNIINVELFKPCNPHYALLYDVMTGTGEPPEIQNGLFVNAVVDAAKKAAAKHSSQIVNESICPVEGTAFLDVAIDMLNDEFKDRIVAVYGLGSLGYGGYVDGWSDFDIDVIVYTDHEHAYRDYQIGKAIEKIIKERGFDRIDIRVYDYEHLNARKTVLEYGQCSRATMLCDSAVLLMGIDIRNRIVRPTREEQNQEGFFLLDHMLSFADHWWDNLPWDDVAAHFALTARLLYTKDTGKVVGKQVAIEFVLERYSDIFDKEQVQWLLWALAMRVHYHPLLVQDNLHGDAIRVLKRTFVQIRNILAEVTL